MNVSVLVLATSKPITSNAPTVNATVYIVINVK
jgi:hypothetical protein